MRTEQRAAHVHVQQHLQAIGKRLMQRAAGQNIRAGVVDPDIDPPKRLPRLVHQPVNLRWSSHIGQHHRGPATQPPYLRCHLFSGIRAPAVDDHIRAGARKSQRQRAADAAGAAGDDSYLATEMLGEGGFAHRSVNCFGERNA